MFAVLFTFLGLVSSLIKPSLDGEAPMSPMLGLALLHTKMWITFVPFYHEIVVK